MIRFEGARRRYDVRDHRPVEIAADVLSETVAGLVASHAIFTRDGRKEALVSLVTPDYRWGMLAWLRSLRKVSQRAVILMVPRAIDVPSDIENVFVLEVPELVNESYVPGRPQYAHVLSKIWMFALTPLDRIAFVDIDCLFLGNIDALFESDKLLAVPNSLHKLGSGHFNSGVIAFSPTPNLWRTIVRKIGALESDMGGDEDALNQILQDDVVYLDEKYNLFRHFHYFGSGAARSDIRILHFVIKKPWEILHRETADGLLVELDDLWTSFLTDQERSELIAHWRRQVFVVNARRLAEGLGKDEARPLAHRASPQGARQTRYGVLLWPTLGILGLCVLMLTAWLR